MGAMADPFVTTHKNTFKWPSNKPLAYVPAAPPITTKHKNFFITGPLESYCHCDGHKYNPQMKRYSQLAEKEKKLNEELYNVNLDMATLANEMLDHSCDTDDEKMESIYQIDYIKRGLNVPQYIKLMPAVESPVGVPVKEGSIQIGNAYRDPTSFRYTAFPRPEIHPCPPIHFCQTPANLTAYYDANAGRSEYQDTISKTGLSILKSRQQFSQPLPSSRRRFGETCL